MLLVHCFQTSLTNPSLGFGLFSFIKVGKKLDKEEEWGFPDDYLPWEMHLREIVSSLKSLQSDCPDTNLHGNSAPGFPFLVLTSLRYE